MKNKKSDYGKMNKKTMCEHVVDILSEANGTGSGADDVVKFFYEVLPAIVESESKKSTDESTGKIIELSKENHDLRSLLETAKTVMNDEGKRWIEEKLKTLDQKKHDGHDKQG